MLHCSNTAFITQTRSLICEYSAMGIPNSRFMIIERRERVFVMLGQGLSQTEIAKKISVNQSTVCRDIRVIKKESEEIIKSFTKDVLPYEYGRCLISVESLIKEAWKIFNDKSGKWTNKDRINALKLVESAVKTKFDILYGGPLYLQVQQLNDKVKELVEIDKNENNQQYNRDCLLHDKDGMKKIPAF